MYPVVRKASQGFNPALVPLLLDEDSSNHEGLHPAFTHCCVIQWMLPAFSSTSLDFTPTTL